MYNQTIGDAVRLNIFRGFNTTVISYGQNNSGKSHSMYGNTIEDSNVLDRNMVVSSPVRKPSQYSEGLTSNAIDEVDGIVFRAIHDLFLAKKRHITGGEVVINATFIEIYNDRIVDLLGHKKPNISSATISEKKLRSVMLKSPTHARHIILNALKRKSQARSHTVCTLSVTINPAVNRNITSGKLSSFTSVDIVSAKLTLVDLAGSNRTTTKDSEVPTSQKTRIESSIIHKDLFVLSQCISALAVKSEKSEKKVHVPFRDSKLTSILRDSLGGNCCTVMVACVAPGGEDLEESLSTLKCAERTRNITNRVKKNLIKTTSLTPAEGAALRRESKMLRSQLLDLTKKYQILRRGKRNVDSASVCSDDGSVTDFQDTLLFSPSNSTVETFSSQPEHIEAQKWRMKCEKLEKICSKAGLSTAEATLSVKDEALLISQCTEVKELKEQIQQLLHAQCDDTASVASCLTFETFDTFDDCSVTSATSTISSLANRSIKSDYLERSKLKEIEDLKLEKRIQEKNVQLNSVDRETILQSSATKMKIEKEEMSNQRRLGELKDAQKEVESIISNLNKSLETLEEKKSKLQMQVNDMEEELQQKERQHVEEVSGHEANLNEINKIVEGLRNQVNALKKEKSYLEEETKRLEQLLKTHQESCEEMEKQRLRIEVELNHLRLAVKKLNQEKLDLFDEVEDLQNVSNLVMEFSQEQTGRQKCEELLLEKAKEIKLLIDERDELKGRIISMKKSNEKENEKFKYLQKEMQTLKEKISSKISVRKPPILQDRTNSSNGQGNILKPPLPSAVHAKRSSSPSHMSVISSISLSNMADIDDQDENNSSTLFGEPNLSFDQDKSVYSCFSETSSLNPEQVAIRAHAQRLLFWANKSMSRNLNDSSTHSHVDLSFDSENESFGSLPFFVNDKENEDHQKLQPVVGIQKPEMKLRRSQSRGRSSRTRSPGPYIIRQNKACTCHGSIFSGKKKEHVEFFLPKLGQACTCGAENVTRGKRTNPTALESFLRPWQVSYLKSVRITTAKNLVDEEKNNANDMAKAMKEWRHEKRMKPAQTKSCLVALQIWSKVARSVLRAEAKRVKEVEAAFDISNCPKFVEFGSGSIRDGDDDFSTGSISTLGNNVSMDMNNSLTLMEGEFEI